MNSFNVESDIKTNSQNNDTLVELDNTKPKSQADDKSQEHFIDNIMEKYLK
jgi:hypothetical protein